ncbi:hypothetical protein AGMMS49941_09590 [Deferribacterales bacterium]|nr:hypothetical protein AGMMS49941_09590 [Deferribacterales bacterium]
MSVVAIVKNETAYIAEWLEYHLLVGVEKFYIYDNNSTDNLKEYLEPYIKAGIVEYIPYPHSQAGGAAQKNAYNDAVSRFKYNSFWLAFIDLDEFLVPVQTETVSDFLREFEDVPSVYVNWLVYGDSGHKTKPNGLVIEHFRQHSETDFVDNFQIKTIANPRYVFMEDIHVSHSWHANPNTAFDTHHNIKKTVAGSYKSDVVLQDKLRLNHYWGKSLEEFQQKVSRGTHIDADKSAIQMFNARNRNEVTDGIMDKYVPPVKEQIAKRFALK